jgi:hypothetical protein
MVDGCSDDMMKVVVWDNGGVFKKKRVKLKGGGKRERRI